LDLPVAPLGDHICCNPKRIQ